MRVGFFKKQNKTDTWWALFKTQTMAKRPSPIRPGRCSKRSFTRLYWGLIRIGTEWEVGKGSGVCQGDWHCIFSRKQASSVLLVTCQLGERCHSFNSSKMKRWSPDSHWECNSLSTFPSSFPCIIEHDESPWGKKKKRKEKEKEGNCILRTLFAASSRQAS